MEFIRWLINVFNKEELEKIKEQYTEEAKAVLQEAKDFSAQVKGSVYIHYDRVNTSSDEFLHGMQPIFNNRFFISWLSEEKNQLQRFIKKSVDEGDKEMAYLNSVKISLVEDLFTDLREFEMKYNLMLNQKKEEQRGGTE